MDERRVGYLVAGDWGCMEVGGSGFAEEWHTNKRSAQSCYSKLRKEFREDAEWEASLVDSSPDLIWTSPEYFKLAFFRFPGLDVSARPPTPDELVTYAEQMFATGVTCSDFLLEGGGEWWDDRQRGLIDKSQIIEEFVDTWTLPG